MKNKVIETGGKENLKVPQQQRLPETDWEHGEREFEENDIAGAISDAHDDPC